MPKPATAGKATEKKTPAVEPETPETAPEPAKPDENARFQALADTIVSGITGALKPAFDALAASRSAHDQPQTPTAPPDFGFPSEAEWEAAEQEGDSVKLSRLQRREARALQKQSEWELERKSIAPLRNTGTVAMATMARKMASKEWEFYPEFKDEIDAMIDTLTPEAQLNPSSLDIAYNLVVGRHAKDIANREREKVIREARETPGMIPGHRVVSEEREPRHEHVDIENLIGGEDGKRAAQALRNHPSFGGDFDRFARKFAGMSGAEYAKRFATREVQ